MTALAKTGRPRMSLVPLFLIAGAAVAYEIALTRYFAVAKWSEYGYWVISIVMVGFALSGVTVALARDWAVRHGAAVLAWLPVALVLAAAGGYQATTANPFNPLQLQNTVTFGPQLGFIALYYAVLLPFFFLTGLYISLTFVLNEDRVARVYGFDLTGAGAGAALVLGLMNVLHPFQLVAALLVLLAASAGFGRRPVRVGLAALAALVASEAMLLLGAQADYNDFKAIYAPLHVPDARQVAEIRSPRGVYALLDDFTERVDTDVSNNAGMLGVPGPPQSFGLYRDGNRIAALPRAEGATAAYAPAALDALPYRLLPGAHVLLAGASGGFRVQQALSLGAGHVDALEPDPVLLDALRHGLGPSPALAADPRVSLSPDSPLAAARKGGRYDLVDVSGDFLDAAEANAAAYTAEAIAGYLRTLAPGGLVSIPVSIREFPVYAVRVLATVRDALRRAHVADPAAHVVVYRSAWNLRILVGNEPWTLGAHRRRARLLRRTVVRRVVLPRHRRGGRPRRHLQRPAGRQLRERRGDVRRRVGGRGGGRGRAGAAGRAQRVAGRLQPGADHPGPPVLLRDPAPRSASDDPETAGDPAAGRGRAARQPRGAAAGRRDRAGSCWRCRCWHRASRAHGPGVPRCCGRSCISPRLASASCSSRSS